ncbi:MAG: hypothetical protein KA054_01820 [Candidatus Moranbacteria bacterium]|nr:hypothetical protein [Candidatus Moranbacteria bacterium]
MKNTEKDVLNLLWTPTAGDAHPAYSCLQQILAHYEITMTYDEIISILPNKDDMVAENLKFICEKYLLDINIEEGNFKNFIDAFLKHHIILFSWRFKDPTDDDVVHLRNGVDHYSVVFDSLPGPMFLFSSPENIFSQFIDRDMNYYSYSCVLEKFIKSGQIEVLKQYIFSKQEKKY